MKIQNLSCQEKQDSEQLDSNQPEFCIYKAKNIL